MFSKIFLSLLVASSILSFSNSAQAETLHECKDPVGNSIIATGGESFETKIEVENADTKKDVTIKNNGSFISNSNSDWTQENLDTMYHYFVQMIVNAKEAGYCTDNK